MQQTDKPIIETDRLLLREFNLTDTAFIIELLNSPGWLQFIGDRNIRTEEQARAYLENGPMKSYLENGYGLWMVETKDNHQPIGMCGIIKRDFLDHPDIGFALLPEYNRHGYGIEAAQATLDHARNGLQLPTITGITVPENDKSIRILERIGLRLSGTIIYPGTNEELLLYIK